MTMKKILSAVLVCALLVCSVFALASCGGGLSGTYELGDTYTEKFMGYEVSFTAKHQYVFSGNSVTVKTVVDTNVDELDFGMLQSTVEGLVNAAVELANTEVTATYEITEEDGVKTITFTYSDSEGDDYPATVVFAQGSDAKGEYISLGGVKYYKV